MTLGSSVASTYLMFGWRQRYLPWNEWLDRASLVPISNHPPPHTTPLKPYSCQGPPMCNVCFVEKVIEIFREGADSCLHLCWVCISSSSRTCDGKSGGGWNGRRSPGVDQKECREVVAAALFVTLIVFTAIKRSRSGLILCSSRFSLSSVHPASLSLCLNYDFRGFPVGAAEVFRCHPPLFFAPASHSSICATLLTVQVFTFSPKKKKKKSFRYLVCYFSSVWKVLSFPGIPSCVKMCWL